ncbi:MAG: MCE family protein, partial [Candidatus Omnitrophica bacterium]|nr:MCE family protein [Candidatus Omnitrophota bacterium]
MIKPRTEVAVGFFVVMGFLILSCIVFFVSGIYFFRPGYHLSALFDYVGIINQGAPVRFSGVRVGEVTAVKILPPVGEQKKSKIEVTFFVEKGVEVREHDEVSIQGTHIMSEPHIAITPVPEGGRVLKDGELIPDGVSPPTLDDLIRKGDHIAKRFDEILETLGGALGDPVTQEKLRKSLDNMNQLLASMNTITAGQEDELRRMVGSMSTMTEEMSQLLKRVNRAEGTLGKLVVEDELYNDLREFIADLKKHPWKLFK